jgi:tetratricopeptide (TPR) repeat protein
MNTETGNLKGQARDCNNIGNIYRAQDDGERPMEYYKKCAELAHKARAFETEAIGIYNQGTVHTDREQYAEAIACYEKAAEMFRKISADEKAAICESNIKQIKEVTSGKPRKSGGKVVTVGEGGGITIGPGGSLTIGPEGVEIEGDVTFEGDVEFGEEEEEEK